ncbi:MAG: hypothetical protein DMD31_14615 [Gemmatimonadetes bacterium]|nr:MAG: hypothetical protein DMD31_14615 [Gemmatimonadota bacterium]
MALSAAPHGDRAPQGRAVAHEAGERLVANGWRHAEVLQGVKDRSHGLERVRHPDGIHIHGEPPAAVPVSRVAPAGGNPPSFGIARKADQIGRHRIAGVRGGLTRHVHEVGYEPLKVPLLQQEAPLARGGHSLVPEIVCRHHRQLKVVVHHDVVFAHGLQVSQHSSRLRQATGVDQSVVLSRVLANRLAAERLFVAHVSRGRELAQRAGDDVLRHRRRPHRLHQQGRHQHVAAEVGREVRQSRHELLAVTQQFHAAYFALEPAEPLGMSRIGSDDLVEPAELVVENVGAGEGRQRRRVRGDAHREAHRAPSRPADRDGASGECGNRLAGIAFQSQPEVAPAVEAHLLDPYGPGGVTALQRHPGRKARAQGRHRPHAEQ